jgi:two-component system, OmpR family, sensor histidine kinase QseC
VTLSWLSAGRPVKGSSIAWIAGARIAAVFAAVATLLVAECVFDYYRDHSEFYRDFITQEVRRIGQCLTANSRFIEVKADCIPKHYTGADQFHYSFRVIDPLGSVLVSGNPQILENIFPLIGRVSTAPFAWQKALESNEWFHVAGGRPIELGGHLGWIETATIGDPSGQRFRTLITAVDERVWLHVVPLFLLTFGITIRYLQTAMRPVKEAAAAVEKIDARSQTLSISHNRLPREVAVLTEAIDRLLERNHALMQSQQRLLAHSAHELRTPLAMMLLELGRVKDEAASRLVGDVHSMSEMVNRLLALTRLEAMKAPPLKPVNLYETASTIITRSQSLVDLRSCQISLVDREAEIFAGDPTSVYDAVRNLVENAVRHTPVGTTVEVTCGPGRKLTVEDGGPGFPNVQPEQLFEPFAKGQESSDGAGLGLAIVKKAVELHRGAVHVGRSRLGGASVELSF